MNGLESERVEERGTCNEQPEAVADTKKICDLVIRDTKTGAAAGGTLTA